MAKSKIPSVKAIMERLGDNLRKEHGKEAPEKAAAIYMEMNTSRHAGWERDSSLEYINKIMCGYGVEFAEDGGCGFEGLLYINMGETYTQTIIFDTRLGKFFVCSWGDYIESCPHRHWR